MQMTLPRTDSGPGLNRRTFLKLSAATGGGLLIELTLPGARALAADGAALAPNAFIRIGRDGVVTLVMHKVEMGQGTYTAISQLIAEELEVPLDSVKLEHAPPDPRYADPIIGAQVTGGSTSIRGAWKPMREAGATARMLMIQAAAKKWAVAPSRLTARDGVVMETGGTRRAGYGELVDVAATLPVPATVTLKDPRDFRLVGTPTRRIDARGKVDGSARFGIDVALPGMKIATVAASPVFGGTLAGVDEAAALKVKGVRQVVKLDHAVAVVADHMWAAKQGLAACKPRWNDGAHAKLDSAAIFAHLEKSSAGPGAIAHKAGDAAAAMQSGTRHFEAVYRQPMLAHLTMEPINCTVDVKADGVDVWVGTQVPGIAQAVAAQTAGVKPEQVRIHNHLLGGGFGRRLEVDFIAQAVAIGKQVRGPVKVVWSREEDVQHDMYRPPYLDRIAATVDAKGMPLAWTHRIAGASIMARFFPPAFKDGVDPDAVDGAVELPYAIPAVQVEYQRVEPPAVPTAFWRGVGPTRNGFVVEGFIDELAAAAGQDAVAYRRALIKDARTRHVLDLAAEKSGWGTPLKAAAGTRAGRGVAVMHVFGSYIAQVAEVEVNADNEVRVRRVTCVIDCGFAVNPLSVTAQMEGGIVFGLSAALWGEITLADGRVQQSNFHDARVMRMNEMPHIAVHIVSSAEAPGGVGEPGTSLAIPALANAVFAATGQRIRTLPIAGQLTTA
ncbi:xanthine dehydrogenase family protein molybdopterin-binding subunit [Methyloversatilis thermotolerans]|uniref:xanthine dehydrogenase family protein molybdopterin-binding subunit n=1 Tax=Methyloversatilis thermotolerans TaxID=1346290 RepID=UPI0003719B67|nr:xanthine dehydrogenase family protein molybdopterin-binding subunit [Methyloversatilis thermotolerans]